MEAGDDAESPEEPSPEQFERLNRTPDATKRRLDVDVEDIDGVDEDEVPQTFERRRKKNRVAGCVDGLGSGSQGSEEQPSEKENEKDAININAQSNTPMEEATASTPFVRMMMEADFAPSIVGKGLVVYWPGSLSAWFDATVQRFDEKGKRMFVYYPEDNHKQWMDLRKVKTLIAKGWIKVCDAGTVDGASIATKTVEATKETEATEAMKRTNVAAALTTSGVDADKSQVGCSKCRYRGCSKCRGYTLAEGRRRKAQQGRSIVGSDKSVVDKLMVGRHGMEKRSAKGRSDVEKDDKTRKADDDDDELHRAFRPMRESDFGPSLEGKELLVFWTKFNGWFVATVESFNRRTKKAKLYYETDDFSERVDRRKMKSLIQMGRIKIAVANDEDPGDGRANGELAQEEGAVQRACRANDDDELDLSQELSQEEGLRYMTKDEFGANLQGRTLSVFWGRGFNAWFLATVQRFDDKGKKAYLYYAADNHHETMDAKKFAILVSKARIKLVEGDVPVDDMDASSVKEVVRLMTRQDLGRGLKGKDVVVFWTDERYKGWYEATVRSFNQDEGLVMLWYRKDKTRETVDPTLMYIPEGRIGFIEERPGDHQLARGELDVRLLDIKGRTYHPKGSNAARKKASEGGAAGTTQMEVEQAPKRHEGDEMSDKCDGNGEGEEPDDVSDEPSEEERGHSSTSSQEEAIMGEPAGDQMGLPRLEDPAFEFGYDGGDDDHGDGGDANVTDAGHAAAIGDVDHCIADSYNASPNPSPLQPIHQDRSQKQGQQEQEDLLTQAGQPEQGTANLPTLPQARGQEHEPREQEQLQERGPSPQLKQISVAEPPASPSQPSVDPWENDRAATIFRWLSTSFAHPLSKQANLAKLRPSLQNAVDFIRDNVRDTIEKSFNNSILVVGAPGSGKTLAVSRVVCQVQEEWNTAASDPRVGIVRLSGVEFSDERAAFREIARQLCDSLNLEYVKTASLGDNIQFLLQILKALAQAGKAAVFILEEFDLFAHTQKQTFLYCLLDSLQKSQAKAVVIGTTCRHDCLDLLEKRVKSRFSHRSITLTPPKTLEDGDIHGSGAKSILTDILSLPKDSVAGAERFNDQVRQAMDDNSVINGLSRTFQFSNSLHTLSRIARKALGAWYASQSAVDNDGGEPLPFAARHLTRAIDEIYAMTSSGYESVIAKLCPLDLSVLAAAHKARAARRNDSLLNFEMIHHEFKTYITSSNLHVDNYSRAAASKSFERLVDCGILRHPRSKGGSLSRRDRHFEPVLVQVTRTELQRGLQKHFNASRQLVDWALRGEIHTTALNEF